jgi:hypothetical protein
VEEVAVRVVEATVELEPLLLGDLTAGQAVIETFTGRV